MRQVTILIVICALLYGCASSTIPARSPCSPPQFEVNTYSQCPSVLAAQLQARGVTIVVLGDQILIVLPSAEIFHPYSANILPSAYSTLDLTVQYINAYTTMLVDIAVYTGNTCSGCIDLELSKDQAKSLSKHFLEAGIDARVLHANGYGGTRMVSKNTLDWHFNMNYRIEITLEKLKVL